MCYNIIVNKIREEGIKMNKREVYKEIKRALAPVKEINVPCFYQYDEGFGFSITLPAKEKYGRSYYSELEYREDWTTKDYLEKIATDLRSFHYDYKSDMQVENKDRLMDIGRKVFDCASYADKKREFSFWKWVKALV